MQQSEKTSLELEIAEITRLIDDYRARIIEGRSSADNFMSITEMEEALSTLRNGIINIYTEIQSKLVGLVDQNELLREKT